MKKLIIIFLFTHSFQVFSQDIRIFENTWYLNDLVIGGISNVPPVNDEVPFVPAEFFDIGEMTTKVCDGGFGELEYFGTTEFEFIYMQFLGDEGCIGEDNQTYNNLYRDFWLNISMDIISYEIIENGTSRSLIITGANNDYAIYGNELLAANDFKSDTFSVFPNPAEDIIYIQKNENKNLSEISIYDINGRLVQLITQVDSNNLKINISALNNGVYFISLKSDSNQVVFQKLIKK